MSSRLWGVYIRSFDGYENVWKFLRGPYSTKREAERNRTLALAERYGVAEMIVKKL